jgi:hypothetical protein
MLIRSDGGVERTKDEWTKLLGDAGFARTHFVQLSESKVQPMDHCVKEIDY